MRKVRRFNRFLLLVAQSLFMLWVVSSLPIFWAILYYFIATVLLDIVVTLIIEQCGLVDFISTKAMDADEYEKKNFSRESLQGKLE